MQSATYIIHLWCTGAIQTIWNHSQSTEVSDSRIYPSPYMAYPYQTIVSFTRIKSSILHLEYPRLGFSICVPLLTATEQ